MAIHFHIRMMGTNLDSDDYENCSRSDIMGVTCNYELPINNEGNKN